MARKLAESGCLIPDCPAAKASHLGVCAPHWRQLTPELQERWREAFFDDARIKVWLAVRRSCIDHLADVGA